MLVVATAIVRSWRVLAQQRAYPANHAGRWEFPGGRVEPGESEPEAVRRECHEELGVDVLPVARVGPSITLRARNFYRNREHGELHLWSARLADPEAEPVALEHLGVGWFDLAALDGIDWLDTDRQLLPAVRTLLGASG